jgi:hypothetical protein
MGRLCDEDVAQGATNKIRCACKKMVLLAKPCRSTLSRDADSANLKLAP